MKDPEMIGMQVGGAIVAKPLTTLCFSESLELLIFDSKPALFAEQHIKVARRSAWPRRTAWGSAVWAKESTYHLWFFLRAPLAATVKVETPLEELLAVPRRKVLGNVGQ